MSEIQLKGCEAAAVCRRFVGVFLTSGILVLGCADSDAFAAPARGRGARARASRISAARAPDQKSTKSPRQRGARDEDSEEGGEVAAGQGPDVCKAMLLADPASGQVIVEQNIHEPLPPASMTKLMTTYVILKRVHDGQLKLSDVVTVSAHASKMGGSQVYLRENEQFPVDDLLNALLIQSANDAAMALAEHVGGSTEGFVAMMTDEAQRLGMKESEFHSPHGLPPSSGELPDKVSANDFAILAGALLREFPEVLSRTKLYESDFRGGAFKMMNHNKLLKSFTGCDGLKTGYYGAAGFSVAATAERNGSRLVTVVMGCHSRKKRDEEAARLLSTGFAQMKVVHLIEKGTPVETAVSIAGGEKTAVAPVAVTSVSVPIRAGDEKNVQRHTELCAQLQAPVKSGTPCGSVSFLLNGHELGRSELAVMEDINQAGMLRRMKQSLGL